LLDASDKLASVTNVQHGHRSITVVDLVDNAVGTRTNAPAVSASQLGASAGSSMFGSGADGTTDAFIFRFG